MHAGKTAVWFCADCTEEQAEGTEPCPLCCGFRDAIAAHDLTDGMQRALLSMLHERQITSVSWASHFLVPKTSSAALERRGLVVINRFLSRMKLTPAGIRLAKELDR